VSEIADAIYKAQFYFKYRSKVIVSLKKYLL